MADIAKLNVKLTATSGAFASTMSGASRHVTTLGRSITSVGSKVFGLGGALIALAAGGGLAYLVKSSMDSIDSMAKLSDRLGIATESLAGLQHHADLSGVSTEQLTGGLEKMLKTIGEAATEGGAGAAALAKMGLSAEALANMAPDQAFGEIAQGLTGIHNPSERARVAMELFGKSGQALLPMMLAGKEGIAAAQAEAQKLGLTFSRVDAAKVEAANDSMTRLQKVFVGAAQTLAIELAPFIDAAASKLTDLGTSGEGMGSRVVSAFEFVLKAIAYGANVIDGFKIGLKGLQIAFAWVFKKGIESATMFADAVAFVVNKSIEGINWVIRQANKLPKVNIPEIDLRLAVDHTMADAIIAGQDELIGELKGDIDELAKFGNADKVTAFFNDIRSKSAESAASIAENSKHLNGAAFDAEDFAEKLKEAEENAKHVTDTIADLEKEVAQFGMGDVEKKLADLASLGATPEQTAKAKELLTLRDELTKLQGTDTGDPLTDFAAKMEKLQALYAQGRVTADQFQRIRQTATETLNSKLSEDAKSITESVRTPLEEYAAEIDKLNVLLDKGLISQAVFDRASLKAKSGLDGEQGAAPQIVRASSAEAQRLAFDQVRGVQRLSKDEIPKKAYAEAQEQTKLLDRIERSLRGGGSDLQVVDI